MELSDYFRIIQPAGWWSLVLMALTAAAAFGFSKMQTPVYESTLRDAGAAFAHRLRPGAGQDAAVQL